MEHISIVEQAKAAKKASTILANTSITQRNAALLAIADSLEANLESILAANAKDMAASKKTAMRDRLMLNEQRISDMAQAARKLTALPDILGNVDQMWQRPNGLKIGQQRVPLGLIGIIYEARPNVTVDAAVLCLKSGNACLLRGGSDALHSNLELARLMKQALQTAGLPEACVEVVADPSRETATQMMKLNTYLDVLIPRGGAGLIKTVVENSTVPVIETGSGNCHVYIDEFADLEMGLDVLWNAKTQRPSVCNACESLVVHEKVAKEFLQMLAQKNNTVELRGDERTQSIIDCTPATEEDFYTEYNDLILSIKIVDSIEEAIEHINTHSTKHSESIITKDYANSQKFLQEISSAAVYINASTRFTDGFEFGFGAEIGISTQKLHARGPMGLSALTTTKYIIYGNGQIRQ
ncbi:MULTISPECIES: glutamate-5-semialdehyde dehydrogenase [unclassified Lactococcus]|uniref:glutamate-5-semialdehyde dehydrogenase n=1 Tax=unclassified Lactococcus TaxID=2643510 RepID=UPI0011C886E5|nr:MULTISPECIES: glutamate-5-semialdehyde dehydrogenase [unclassified Lactococcus]MQW23693.1 glutamate-5-semialdehyde dehydrogenase [Lactococcus sp. dk101]TXK37525.1 glutamate-5-semialdehyde dehydrogenase [Lactococcus sp. dk310]TXK48957.1 glutamate-5-semialdehyde dehydrogenase [Lactococcus sp. dk322]